MARQIWLRPARQAVGLSQAALAARVPCDQSTISLYESGRLTATPEFERALLLALAQGPAPPYVDSKDLSRPPKELLAEASACRDALQVIGRAIGAGDGDKETLLALVGAIYARTQMLVRAIDLRQRARESS